MALERACDQRVDLLLLADVADDALDASRRGQRRGRLQRLDPAPADDDRRAEAGELERRRAVTPLPGGGGQRVELRAPAGPAEELAVDGDGRVAGEEELRGLQPLVGGLRDAEEPARQLGAPGLLARRGLALAKPALICFLELLFPRTRMAGSAVSWKRLNMSGV